MAKRSKPAPTAATEPAQPAAGGLGVSTLTRRSVLADSKALAATPGLVVRLVRNGTSNLVPIASVQANGLITLDGEAGAFVHHKSVVEQLPADDIERQNGYWEYAS